jgi:hypothetical protein
VRNNNEACAVVGDVTQSSAPVEGTVRPVAFGLCSPRLYGTASYVCVNFTSVVLSCLLYVNTMVLRLTGIR